MWEWLPELILVQVFGHLGREDRVSAAQVCPHWARCLSSPSLWRRCAINIDIDLGREFSLGLQLAVSYGEHMRRLEFGWSQPRNQPPERWLSRGAQLDAGAEFIALLRVTRVRLNELVLANWAYRGKWAGCGKLLCQLANLLACQENLESLSLVNANLSLRDVQRLLILLAELPRLAKLDLRGAFKERQAPHGNSRYLRQLGQLHALAHLSLDYPALSDGALAALAAGTRGRLLTLHVSLRDSDSRQHRLTDSAWRALTDACPGLAVSYAIMNIWHHEDMCYLLLPSVPLAKFQMSGGNVWDQSRSRNFRATIGLLITHYTETLDEVMLQFKNSREMLDDLIISMITRCKRLKHVQYDGILRNFETIRDICQLQVDRKTCFQSIHLKPRNPNSRNRTLLHDINNQFNRKLSSRKIDLRIENSV